MKRTTIFLSDETHEALRREAFRARVSMAELIRMRLRKTLAPSKRNKRIADPLMKVAGICRGDVLSDAIDDELYG